MWFNFHSSSVILCSFVSFFILFCSVVAQQYDGVNVGRDKQLDEGFDCSNRTHSWRSQHNSCLLDPIDNEASLNKNQEILDNQKTPGRYIGGLGLRIRDSECAANETRCWIVNCCKPFETCGPINVGCTVSYSTLYSTSTTTIWSTITDFILPSDAAVSYTTTETTSTTYLTKWVPVTLPGVGVNDVITKTTSTSTTLVMSAYTPPPVVVTQTASADSSSITSAPKLRRTPNNVQLPRANIPRQDNSVRYTTIQVLVSIFQTQHQQSTISSNALLTAEKTITVSSVATRNQTFYRTPSGFRTITETDTVVSTSYAFGRLDAATQTAFITPSAPSSEVAGTTPTGTADPSQSNPPSAYPAVTSHHLSPGAIAGLVVGIILALILLALLVILACCIRRKRNRRAGYDREVRNSRNLVDPPSPPSAPVPQMAVVSTSPNTSSDSPSPPAAGGISRVGHNGNGSSSRYGYGHGRKSSRSSVVSITPVPEEDEEDLENEERSNSRTAGLRRNSGESTRSWGRGYGGRGGYNGRPLDGRHRNGETASPTNHAFRGVMTSTYSDESLVPPHARASHE